MNRDAGEHVLEVDPVAKDGGRGGELGARVHTDLERLRGELHGYRLARLDEEPDRVGQVELALGVLRLDPVEGRPERVAAEHIDRGVGLTDRELGGRRVARLDDPLEPASVPPHEPAVVARVRILDTEHGCRRARGSVGGDEVAEVVRREEDGVAGEDENVRRRCPRGRRGPRAPRPRCRGASPARRPRDRRSRPGSAARRPRPPDRRRRRRRPSAPSRPCAVRARDGGASGTAERIRVPSPAAMTTAAIGVSVTRWVSMAGAPGFEPGIAGPKPAALPLGYAPENAPILADHRAARFEPTQAFGRGIP